MPATASRLSVFTESVIRGTTRLANQYGAINLAQGFPDFDPPEELLVALERATRGPHHQYAVTWGAPRFREALARKIQRFTGLPIHPVEKHRRGGGGGIELLPGAGEPPDPVPLREERRHPASRR